MMDMVKRCLAVLVVAPLFLGGCVDETAGGADDELEAAASKSFDPYQAWRLVRSWRQARLDDYLADNPDGFAAFLDQPLGSVGIPTLLFDNFPALFPEIWGAPGDALAVAGFGHNPWNPDGPPLGLGKTIDPSTGLEVQTLSCGGCHMGKVIGPDGEIIPLVGAPNTQFNQFRTRVEMSVMDPRYAALGDNPLTNGFKEKVLQRRALIEATMDGYTFNPARFPNAPYLHNLEKPGFLDAIGVALVILTLPEVLDPAQAPQIIPAVMPPAPAEVDIPSVWRQGARPTAQWDGTIANPVYRNLAAQVGVIGVPQAIDFSVARDSATFNENLPPPPYPFDVHIGKALAGRLLYKKYCAGCHDDGTSEIFPASEVGTDPNREVTVQAEGRARLIAVLRAACTDPAVCDVPDEEIIRDLEADAGAGRGYLAGPLDGIWARAPYLHNGSVPTLYHLLVPESRPEVFVRGSIHYDQDKVGFAWSDAASGDAGAVYYDTTLAGASNGGHDTAAFNGLDWGAHPKALEALLEYMKTL